jgi:uncharacterized protein (DUF1330 family)
MTSNYKLVSALLVGAAFGGFGIQAIHAQAKPPVYVVVDVGDVTDPAGWRANTERSNAAAAALLQEFGGRFLARTDKLTKLDGDNPPKRIIIIAFDSVEKAQGWYNSPAQKQVNEVRFKTTKSRSFIAEGL